MSNNTNDWIALCEYVKKEILEYDENMLFPKYLALKLRGLMNGQHIANNNIKKQSNYDCKTLLATFKLCKSKIVNYLHQNNAKINDEHHKINIIIKIIEPEINDVYIRLQEAKKSMDKVQNVSVESHSSNGAAYQPKTKEVNDKLKGLF